MVDSSQSRRAAAQAGRALLAAAAAHDAAAVARLLAAGAPVDHRDRRRRTALHVACAGAHRGSSLTPVVLLLLEYGADPRTGTRGQDGPLHFAVMYGQAEAAQALIAAGALVNQPGDYGRTALIYAAHGRSPELVRMLLQAGADVTAKTADGSNALFDALAHGDGDPAVIAALIDGGLDCRARHRHFGGALAFAASCGHLQAVDALLAAGVSVDQTNVRQEPAIVEAMHAAKPEIVRRLLSHGANPEATTQFGSSVFAYVAEQGDLALLELMWTRQQQGATQRRRRSSRHSAVSWPEITAEALVAAAGKGRRAVVGWLLDRGVPIDAQDDCGETALIKAVAHRRVAVMRTLLRRGAALEIADADGNSALLHAAYAGNGVAVSALLSAGADLERRNRLNWSALMQACVAGQLDAAQRLLAAGARTDVIDEEKGATALTLAEHARAPELVALLRAHGATARVIRERDPGDAWFSILDCDICAYFPHNQSLARNEMPEPTEGLRLVDEAVSYPDRHETRRELLKCCQLCETYYLQIHSIDWEDAFVGGPSVSEQLRRLNPLTARRLLQQRGLAEESAAAAADYERLIAALRRGIGPSGRRLRATTLPFVVEALCDRHLLADDWPSLHRELLTHRDGRVVLRSAADLAAIARHQPGDAWHHSHRLFTAAVKVAAERLLQAHRLDVRGCLEAVRPDGDRGLQRLREQLLSSAEFAGE